MSELLSMAQSAARISEVLGRNVSAGDLSGWFWRGVLVSSGVQMVGPRRVVSASSIPELAAKIQALLEERDLRQQKTAAKQAAKLASVN